MNIIDFIKAKMEGIEGVSGPDGFVYLFSKTPIKDPYGYPQRDRLIGFTDRTKGLVHLVIQHGIENSTNEFISNSSPNDTAMFLANVKEIDLPGINSISDDLNLEKADAIMRCPSVVDGNFLKKSGVSHVGESRVISGWHDSTLINDVLDGFFRPDITRISSETVDDHMASICLLKQLITRTSTKKSRFMLLSNSRQQEAGWLSLFNEISFFRQLPIKREIEDYAGDAVVAVMGLSNKLMPTTIVITIDEPEFFNEEDAKFINKILEGKESYAQVVISCRYPNEATKLSNIKEWMKIEHTICMNKEDPSMLVLNGGIEKAITSEAMEKLNIQLNGQEWTDNPRIVSMIGAASFLTTVFKDVELDLYRERKQDE